MAKDITLKKAVAGFIHHLDLLGKTSSTIGTSRRTLDLLIGNLGEEKIVAKILAVHTSKFFNSEAATTQPGKKGMKPRAEASIKQIRRITRQFLFWCVEQGYLDKAPLPKDEVTLGNGLRKSEVKDAEAAAD